MGKAGAVRAGRAYVELYADNSRLVRGLKSAEGQLRNFGRNLSNIGRNMTALGVGLGAPLALAAKHYMSFSDAMLQVKAVTGSTAAEFAALESKAEQLGATTSFTTSEIAGAMLSLGRAGFDPTEIDQSIAGMLNLARATGTELPLAAEIAAASLRGFGMEASEMDHVADVLVATANNSAQTLEDLGESMKYVAPISKRLGMSIEDTAIALGTLANAGIKGSMAGTSMRQMELSLANPKTQKLLREIGVEALDAEGNVRDFGEVLVEFGNAMASMPNAQQLQIGKELFKQRAVTSAMVVSEKASQRMVDAIRNATGIAAQQAAEMDSGLGGAWRRLTSAADVLSNKIGGALAPSLIRIGEILKSAVDGIAAFVEQNQWLVVSVGMLAGGLVTVGPALIGVGLTLQGMATAAGVAAAAIGMLTTPFGLAVAAAAGLTAAFVTQTQTGARIWDEFVGTISDILAPLKSTFDETFAGIAAALQGSDITTAMEILAQGMRVQWAQINDIVASAVAELMRTIQTPMSTLGAIDQWLGEVAVGTAGAAAGPIVKASGVENMRYEQPARSAEKDAAREKARQDAMLKRANEIAAAQAKLRELTQQAETSAATADKAARLEAAKKKLEELKAAAAAARATPPEAGGFSWTDWAASQVSSMAGMAGGTAGAMLDNLMGADWQGLAGKAGDAAEGMLAGDAVLPDHVGLATGAAQSMATETRGTFSGVAAARMGGFLSATPMDRAANGIDKIAVENAQMRKRLDQIADAAKNAKLVFAGQLGG